MRRAHGFTLIELAVTIAIIGILAAGTYGLSRAAFRNASLGSATFELASRLSGLKAAAITEQEDYVFVVIDAPNASACGVTDTASCARWFVLRVPDAAFTLSGFSPTSPGEHAQFVEQEYLPRGVKLDPDAPGSPPPPFSAISYFPSELTYADGGVRRFAIRFARDGSVIGVPAGSATGPWTGYAFALTTDQQGQVAAADRKGIVVAFPAGVARTYSVP